jgi:hypothetical protein
LHLKAVLENMLYPRSKYLRSLIDRSRMQALTELLDNRDFKPKEDWPKMKRQARYLARQELEDLIRHSIQSLEKNP